MLHACPVCRHPAAVDGTVCAEEGPADRFLPQGLRLLTWRRSVRLSTRIDFKACTRCGHVWGRLDAAQLRALIDRSGKDALKQELSRSMTSRVLDLVPTERDVEEPLS